jgi:hypothetical protein
MAFPDRRTANVLLTILLFAVVLAIVYMFAPTGKNFVLQAVDPAFLTGDDVHKLLPNGRMAESRNQLVMDVHAARMRHGAAKGLTARASWRVTR